MLNEEAFLNKRLNSWKRLDQLNIVAQNSTKKMGGTELIEYVRLYRQASADLAYMRTHSSNQSVVDYLNRITGQAYSTIYRRPITSLGKAIKLGMINAAQTFRRTIWAFVLSCAIFFFAAVVNWLIVVQAPDLRHYVIPAEMEPLFEHWKETNFDSRTTDDNISMTAMYATNNPSVALRTLGLSVGTAGIGTVYITWFNGGLIGSLSAEMNSVGRLWFLMSSIWPHGVSEIGGLLISSAAGFVLAGAILFPGRRRVIDSLRDKGKDVLALTITSIVMIFMAAPIEGFFSFNNQIPQEVKAAFAFLSFVVHFWFFGYFGRDKDTENLKEIS